MARDASDFAQQATLVLLKRAPELAALVPPERGYPLERPVNSEWPFYAIGAPIVTPFLAAGMDGSALSFAVHVYAETTGSGESTVDGRAMASAILRVVVAVLGGEDARDVQLQGDLSDCPFEAIAQFNWTGSQVMQDGADASAFHAFANFDVSIVS